MKKIISFFIFLTTFTSYISAQQSNKYDLNVGDFNELRVNDAVNVDYKYDSAKAGKAEFECLPEYASSFMFNNKGGKLTIQLSSDALGRKDIPKVTVYSKFLSKVENNADSTVRVMSLNSIPKFEAKIEGNGRLVVHEIDANEVKGTMRLGHGILVLTGVCKEAKLNLTGTGVIQADELKADNVSVNAKGTGSVGVDAEVSLGVYGMGSTSVYYVGNPEIKNRSVGLKLIPLKK